MEQLGVQVSGCSPGLGRMSRGTRAVDVLGLFVTSTPGAECMIAHVLDRLVQLLCLMSGQLASPTGFNAQGVSHDSWPLLHWLQCPVPTPQNPMPRTPDSIILEMVQRNVECTLSYRYSENYTYLIPVSLLKKLC